jgi:alpha-D-ribose 1-methylphosphonate 5-triphosphate synthase subunit PhnG
MSKQMTAAMSPPNHIDHPDPERRHWMAVLARADSAAIADCLEAWGTPPGFTRLRGPESGLVMVRGRTGGNGAPFNLGEMTVTRCSVRTGDGLVGHAYVAGRDDRQAELAALVDALMQDPARRESLRESVIAPLESVQAGRREALAAKAAATKVQFFAMRTMRS